MYHLGVVISPADPLEVGLCHRALPIGEAMALIGHRNVQTLIRYYRSGELLIRKQRDSWSQLTNELLFTFP